MEPEHRIRKLVLRLVFLALLGWVVALVRAVRPRQGWDEWSEGEDKWVPKPAGPADDDSDEPQAARRPFRTHKLATSFALVVVFFAAATFTAGAGDMIAKAFDPARCAALMQATGEDESVCAELMQEEAAPEPAPVVEEPAAAPEPQPVAEPAAEAAAPAAVEPTEATPEAVAPEAEADVLGPQDAASEPAAEQAAAPSTEAPAAEPTTRDQAAAPEPANPDSYILAPEEVSHSAPATKTKTRHWVVRRAKETKAHALPVENEGGSATVWLNRALPDPTPPAKRLSPKFAKNLQRISAANGVSWALVLGVLRAEGARDRVPATVRELNALARGLSKRGAAESEWNAALSLSGRTGFADRAVALARYNRVVGLNALVKGLEKANTQLVERLLGDPRAHIYGAGRDDVQSGRIDVRVVVLISYLAESYGEVTVSSLFSGHRKYARPGVVSAHIYGHAADISSVGGTPMTGHQQPGSITEKAVRSILMLPVEIQPRQVISLLGLGGASFPLANHHDHIHVGF